MLKLCTHRELTNAIPVVINTIKMTCINNCILTTYLKKYLQSKLPSEKQLLNSILL